MSTDIVEVQNPFRASAAPQPNNAIAEVAMQREIAEVQAAVIAARRFPRDVAQAAQSIIRSCQRKSLADAALFLYPKGGNDVTGPSIRLAECIAQAWGNIQFGVRELEQRRGESTVESYAIDLETNTRQSKVFQVTHIRHTRDRGDYMITDPREIYENNANSAARRLRACILGIIPGDVVEAAVEQCEQTLAATVDASPEGIAKMVAAFAAIGVSEGQIAAKLRCSISEIKPEHLVKLRKIYVSLKEGLSRPNNWFRDGPAPAQSSSRQARPATIGGGAALKAALEKSAAKAAETPTEAPAQPEEPTAAPSDHERAKAEAMLQELAAIPDDYVLAHAASDAVREPMAQWKKSRPELFKLIDDEFARRMKTNAAAKKEGSAKAGRPPSDAETGS